MDIVIGGKYRHFKGHEYEVVDIVRSSENPDEELVIYKALYGDGQKWARPKSMWFDEIDRDGYKGPRFTFISDGN